MLEGDVALLQRLEHAAAEAQLAVHHILFHSDGGKSFFARNAGDRAAHMALVRSDDHGAGVIRLVGVANVDRDAGHAHRENRVLVQHARAHIGKLAQFAVGDDVDALGALDDARIRHQKARNIGPVFIKLCARRARDDRAGDV